MAKYCTQCIADAETIPFVAHESEMARSERQNKRLFAVSLALLGALIISNAAWTIRELRMPTIEICHEVERSIEESGNNIYIGGNCNAEN